MFAGISPLNSYNVMYIVNKERKFSLVSTAGFV